jgi:hypothetical protein
MNRGRTYLFGLSEYWFWKADLLPSGSDPVSGGPCNVQNMGDPIFLRRLWRMFPRVMWGYGARGHRHRGTLTASLFRLAQRHADSDPRTVYHTLDGGIDCHRKRARVSCKHERSRARDFEHSPRWSVIKIINDINELETKKDKRLCVYVYCYVNA